MTNKEEVEVLKAFVIKDIPDNPYTRKIAVDVSWKTGINAHDICVLCVTIIDAFIGAVEEKYQNEDEAYIMKTLPLLLVNKHHIVEKQN